MDGVHSVAIQYYNQLEGMRFSGRYMGIQQNPNYGTERAVFEVDTKDPNNHSIVGLFDQIRKKISMCQAYMWRGFSGQKDYDHDLDWDLWIWAPKSCSLHPSAIEKVLEFEITNVEFFEFNYSYKHDYEVGVNISVDEYDSYRNLENEYHDLQGMQFHGRYIGQKCDEADVWHAVYEVDRDVPFNHEICHQFDSIRRAWKEDGRRVHKSFTDDKDSHQGYNWNLWIWASEDCAPGCNSDSDSSDSDRDSWYDEEQTFTITGAEINNWVAFIEVK